MYNERGTLLWGVPLFFHTYLGAIILQISRLLDRVYQDPIQRRARGLRTSERSVLNRHRSEGQSPERLGVSNGTCIYSPPCGSDIVMRPIAFVQLSLQVFVSCLIIYYINLLFRMRAECVDDILSYS